MNHPSPYLCPDRGIGFTMHFSPAPGSGHPNWTRLRRLLRRSRASIAQERAGCSAQRHRRRPRNSPFFRASSVFLWLLLNSSQPIRLPPRGWQTPVTREQQVARSCQATERQLPLPPTHTDVIQEERYVETNLKTLLPHLWQPKSISLLPPPPALSAQPCPPLCPPLCLPSVSLWGCFSAQLHGLGALVAALCWQPPPAAQNRAAQADKFPLLSAEPAPTSAYCRPP